MHVERWWPQRAVLSRAAAVVAHGGFGTTQAALEAGVPQVVLPLFSFDQFVNADRVAAVGVGVALVHETSDEPRAGDLVPRGPAATDRLAEALCVAARAPLVPRPGRRARPRDRRPADVDACVQALGDYSGSET